MSAARAPMLASFTVRNNSQNTKRIPNCNCRDCSALVITPNADDSVAVGLFRFTWLNTLKASVRNSILDFSPIVKFLVMAKSNWLKVGPRNPFLAAVPNVKGAGVANAAAFTQQLAVRVWQVGVD